VADGRVLAAMQPNALVNVRRRELALGLMAAGAPRSIVVRTLESREGMTTPEATRMFLEVCEECRVEFEDARPYLKSQQVERLQRDLANMRAAGTKKGAQVSYRSIAQHEALLARVVGTIEPAKAEVSIDATIRESLVAVVGGMDRERMDALVEEQLSLEARAGVVVVPTEGREVPGSGREHGVAGGSTREPA